MPLPTCPETGKRSFRGRREAVASALAYGPRRAAFRRPFRAYLCPFCHCWHLTKHPPYADHLARLRRLGRKHLGDTADD